MAITREKQGWCTDPFERHEARWLSAGVPTKLVRDGSVEQFDAPVGVMSAVASPITWCDQGAYGADLLRSDQQVPSRGELLGRIASVVFGSGSD